jgi:predicted O-linked N-acetylglucosamine transferase (SPINDLY family)
VALFAAALAHHESGRVAQAQALYREVLANDPEHAESLHLLGLITAQVGNAEEGIGMIRRAMAAAPGRAPHHNSLAIAYRTLGRDAEAVAQYREAAALRPESAEIHNNLATTLQALGQHTEAVAEYRLAAKCGPRVAEIWYNLASALTEGGQPEEVEVCFRRAIDLKPDFASAVANYGRWLTTRTRWVEAAVWLSEAVRLTPEDARSWNNLGIAHQEAGRSADAEADYRSAIAVGPEFADTYFNLGCLLAIDGRTDEATSCHAAAIAADPLHGAARLALCTAQLPVLYGSAAEVGERRCKYLAALNALCTAAETPAVAHALAAAIGTSQPFFLPYQGRNDTGPQRDFGRLVCRLIAGTDPPAPLAPPLVAGERIRLGIVSGYFHDHTIFRLFLEGWLTELDRDRFELTAFHTGRTNDAQTAICAQLSDRFVSGMNSPAAWRAAVCGKLPHALLYPEVGMDPVAARLAAQRLAPVQCVAWGHPETTGLPTMDYFLSAAMMEPPDGDAHYTERLVTLPGLGTHYAPSERPIPELDRVTLGLDPEVPLYWSGQALYKYLPEYDQIYPRIAAAVGPCQFVFIGFARSDAVTAMFRERLRRAFAGFGLDADRHCAVLPPMPQQRFIAAADLADVVLDTPGWSGGRSTLDCLATNPAIVTLPGAFMRGRHTAAILRRIGCEATIARSLDDYVAIAAQLGRDLVWRTQVRAMVAEGKHRAFRDTDPIRALETFLAGALARL